MAIQSRRSSSNFDKSEDELLRNKIDAYTRQNLGDGKGALQEEADLERKVYVLLFEETTLHRSNQSE